ncbi:MAG: Crp/Fnr family transcriptional regulator [Acidimicrobiales bacterium]
MPHTKAPLETLAACPLFEGLQKKQLRRLRDEFKDADFKPGATIITEGQKGGRFFLVIEGKVTVSVRGKQKSVLGPGDCFGEWALVDGGVRTATITADTEVQALTLAPWTFKAMLLGEPDMMFRILQQTVRRYREMSAEVV